MYKIPNEILEEINFIKTSELIPIKCQSDLEYCIKTNTENITKSLSKNATLYLTDEWIHTQEVLDNIIELASNKFDNFKIITCTSTKFDYSTHPLTNLLLWNEKMGRHDISWDFNDIDYLFDKFSIGKSVNENREFKGILSIRKRNRIRDILFSKNIKINEGICRYANWPHHNKETQNDIERKPFFPKWNDLLSEYDNSIFSFVVETRDNDSDNQYTDSNHNSLTEKTLISFLTGTIPIVLGGNGFVKELTDMGFKVWNNDFGFSNADEQENYSKIGLTYFYECINRINTMTLIGAQEYWKSCKKDIQHNYDLASTFICNKQYNLFNPN